MTCTHYIKWGFQSTLPCGERHTYFSTEYTIIYFNPRSRVGSDQFGYLTLCFEQLFQSTLPCGERQAQRSTYNIQRFLFQSTLPCGERHATKKIAQAAMGISIHAPVWGATSGKTKINMDTGISIHAPVWGATC